LSRRGQGPRQSGDGAGQIDPLLQGWNEIVSLRMSADQFNGRLIRTAPVVAELAASYPELRDAVQVVNVLVANLGLARAVLGRTAPPAVLLERAG
jgi:hypothetical protein